MVKSAHPRFPAVRVDARGGCGEFVDDVLINTFCSAMFPCFTRVHIYILLSCAAGYPAVTVWYAHALALVESSVLAQWQPDGYGWSRRKLVCTYMRV